VLFALFERVEQVSGCSRPAAAPPGQIRNISSMEKLCKDQAALRYSTDTRRVDVNHFEQFQASYELSGLTSRNERIYSMKRPLFSEI
jgi:hypothetical protein